MNSTRLLASAAVAVVALSITPAPASAQQGQDWFVPGGQQQRAAPGRPAQGSRATPRGPTAPPSSAVPVPVPGGPAGAPGPGGPGAAAEPPPTPLAQFQLPPEPTLPPLGKGSAPPAAVIGVLGVPEVMRACSAAQEVERVIGQRRQRLNEDAQKEQTAWRDLQQQLASQRANLSPEQIRNKERELQERITDAQRQFRERNRVIQEAAQFALAQIERALVSVIRQVAESRGMNLVLHRNQIALNVNEFDLTDQVTAQLNKVLPSVVITEDGKEPPTLPLAQGGDVPGNGGTSPASAGPPGVSPGGAPRTASAPQPGQQKP